MNVDDSEIVLILIQNIVGTQFWSLWDCYFMCSVVCCSGVIIETRYVEEELSLYFSFGKRRR